MCPAKSAPHRERSFSQGYNIKDDILLDAGIWDMGPTNEHAFINLNRDFEAKMSYPGGTKCLRAHAYYTEEEFWNIRQEELLPTTKEVPCGKPTQRLRRS